MTHSENAHLTVDLPFSLVDDGDAGPITQPIEPTTKPADVLVQAVHAYDALVQAVRDQAILLVASGRLQEWEVNQFLHSAGIPAIDWITYTIQFPAHANIAVRVRSTNPEDATAKATATVTHALKRGVGTDFANANTLGLIIRDLGIDTTNPEVTDL